MNFTLKNSNKRRIVISFFVLISALMTVNAQSKITFVIGETISDPNSIRFRDKSKYLPTEFYAQKKINIDKVSDRVYEYIISEPTVVNVAMINCLSQGVYLFVEDTIFINKIISVR